MATDLQGALDGIFDSLRGRTISVFGDFCLDAYWQLDEGETEYSVETGLPVQRIRVQRYSLGGAGNVAANLAAMGVGQVRAIGVVGQDMFAGELRRLCIAQSISVDSLLSADGVQTMAYVKPCLSSAELSRLDFGAFNLHPEHVAERLLERLEQAFCESDAVILNQQVPGSISQPQVIAKINRLIAAHPAVPCVIDARHFARHYTGAIIKVNLHEAARLLGEAEMPEAREGLKLAQRIHERSGREVFLTRGADGIVAVNSAGRATELPAVRVREAIDPVGAGDTIAAALAAALSAKVDTDVAAEFANVAASVTIRQLQRTGTASPAQIREAAMNLRTTEQASGAA